MAFDDYLFPVNYSRHAIGGPSLSASPVSTPGGARQVVQNWDEPLRQWRVGKKVKHVAEIESLYHYYLGRRGIVHTFPFLDPLDHEIERMPTLPSTGDGANDAFQIVNRYDRSGRELVRSILLPVLATVEVYRDDVLAAASAYAVDRGTGIVTFTSPPASGVAVDVSCEFHMKAHFLSDAAAFDLEMWRLGSWDGVEIMESRN